MKFFPQGRLGNTIITATLWHLRMLVEHSPPHDPWMRGESFIEIIKRIAHLEDRDVDVVSMEIKAIRLAKGDSEKFIERMIP